MTWAAVAGAVVSVGAGAASSAIKNNSAEDGSMGYDMPMMDRAPWDIDNQKLSAQMAQNAALRSEQGRLNPGMEILLNRMKAEQLRKSKEAMYGTAGRRGGSVMDNTMSMATQGGVGPKAMMAQGSRAMQDYAGRNAQIMNYIDSLKFAGLGDQQKTAFSQMQQMPRSTEIPYQGQVIPMNTPATPGMDTGIQNIDYTKLFENSGWFDKTPATPQQTQVTPQITYNPSQYGPLTL